MKDFNLKITVRNNRLLTLIEDQHESAARFCRKCGLSYGGVINLLGMRASPTVKSGDWSKLAIDTATALGVYPSDIWPDHMQGVKLKQSTATMEINSAEVARITNPDAMDQVEVSDLVEKMFEPLSPRYEKFMRWRAGDGADATLKECGKFLGVSVERARQIEAKSMRQMREHAQKRYGIKSLN